MANKIQDVAEVCPFQISYFANVTTHGTPCVAWRRASASSGVSPVSGSRSRAAPARSASTRATTSAGAAQRNACASAPCVGAPRASSALTIASAAPIGRGGSRTGAHCEMTLSGPICVAKYTAGHSCLWDEECDSNTCEWQIWGNYCQ